MFGQLYIYLMKAVIVVPTYNERENVRVIIPMLFDIARTLPSHWELHVLVVDDTSPDKTADVITELQQHYPSLHLLMGKKQGLGRAYIRGMKHALNTLNADVVFEMDADLSHDPYKIPDFLAAIDAGADFVIGSRYVPGGSIPANWPAIRVLNSKLANLLARYVVGIYGVRDCTGGFRAIRAHVLRAAHLDTIKIVGYAFQVVLLQRAVLLHAKIVEVPIQFQDRTIGVSKMRLKDQIESVVGYFQLRWHSFTVQYGLQALTILAVMGFTAIMLLSTDRSSAFVLTVSGALLLQSIFNIWLMIYAWENPHRDMQDRSPSEFLPAQYSFTALVPMRHEELVARDTITCIANIDYPEHLKQTLVICRYDDEGTIEVVRKTLSELGKDNVQLVIMDGLPINKPHQMNVALPYATGDVVTVFDAEDQPHAEIYHVANTVMVRDEADIVQSGVQLMNFETNWYSLFNVLEYFFWFKSVLPFFARQGVIPLGGNTVFFKKHLLVNEGGWDENCLTEDGDIGLRLSRAGAKVRVVYEERHATQEETPHNLGAFIKQRTRWGQGFIQILQKKEWAKFLSLKHQLLALYVLAWPEAQAFLFLYLIFSLIAGIWVKFPVWVTMLSLLPLLLLIVQFVILVVGMYEFTVSYQKKFAWYTPLKMALFFYPFQIILGLSTTRAMFRLITGQMTWEKTTHIGAHRPSPAVVAPISNN